MILLTGGSGQLGTELQKLRKYYAPSHENMDLTDFEAVQRLLLKKKPTCILHAAAYTKVQLPEQYPEEAHECYMTNVVGTRNLVKAADCPIIFISTETVLHPYNFYAITKLQAENEVKKAKEYTIIRTSFREIPFEYPKAPTDMYTIGDYAPVIARLIDKSLSAPIENKTIYVGTGVKTMYELAIRSRLDVEPIQIKDIPQSIAPMTELLNV